MVTRYEMVDGDEYGGGYEDRPCGNFVMYDDYAELSEPAFEWLVARSEFIALPAGDARSAQFLNRLSEAEDGLRGAISKAKGEQE